MEKQIKLLLIQPFYKDWSRKLPLGLAYLASTLEQNDKFVKVLDLCALRKNDSEIIQFIRENNINLVGITSTTPQIFSAWRLAKVIKNFDGDINIVLGGVHPSVLPEESLEKDFINFVVVGEGERTLLELVSALENGSSFENIDGLVYKDNGLITTNNPRKFIDDLDEIPFPSRRLFPFPEKYISPGQYHKFFADILTSRGCPFSCTFCANKAVFGRNFRARSPENVIKEIIFLKNKYKLNEIHISDDNFTLDGERAKKICKLMIKNRLKMKWACGNGIHVSTIDEELAEYMKRAGCYRVGIGIETGNKSILSKLGKQITLEMVERAVNLLKRNKIITVGLFMFGNIGENKKTMMDTIRFAKELDLDYAQFFILTPFPGTPVFRYLKQRGYLLSENWKDYRNFNKPLFRTEDITEELLLKMYSSAYRQFYFRPFYILKRVYKFFTNYYEFRIGLKGLPEIFLRILKKRKYKLI